MTDPSPGIITEMLRQAASMGLVITAPVTDGTLSRCPVEGHPGRRDGAYIIHLNEPPSIWAMNHVTGQSDTWTLRDRAAMTDAERAVLHDRIERGRQVREADRAARHVEAAAQAQAIYDGAVIPDPSGHPYALGKRLPMPELVRRGPWPQREWPDALIIPIYQVDGRISTLQAIDDASTKDLLAAGAKRGGFHPLGRVRGAERVLIGEGLATVAVACQATGLPGVMAIDAGNLLPVAETVRRLAAPSADIIILADDDQRTDRAGNPGMEAATRAAQTVGGRLALPSMGRKADMWDIWAELGPEAVRERIDAAVPVADHPSDWDPDGGQRPGKSTAPSTAVVLCAADIRPESISWIWDGYLAAGKLHIIGGSPGTGKTTLALTLAAIIARGGRYPDGSLSRMGRVLIWSGEDDPTDTIVPRLIAAGADLSRVHILSGMTTGPETRPFDPAVDMAELVRVARDLRDVRLIIVDPVVSAVTGDSHKNAEVRRSLQPLVTLGAETGAAILGITHFSKGSQGRDATERIVGSIAFAALARVVMVAARRQDTEQGAARVFIRAKSNIGPDDGGYGYDLEQVELSAWPGVYASRVVWAESITGSATDILTQAETPDSDEDGAMAEAMEFVGQMMEGGPVPARTIQAAAREAGVSSRTLARAKKRMGILSERVQGSATAWQWVRPGTPAPVETVEVTI